MPVTFTLVPHAANEINGVVSSTPELLLGSATRESFQKNIPSIFSSSFGQGDQTRIVVNDCVGTQNGLVDVVLAAHNQHHALVLRPDDIWLAIMSQFSFFVNKNAEQLRGRFVAHTGQKHIELEVFPPALFDGAYLAPAFAKELTKHITDIGLCKWIVPEFSTTTVTDQIVGCVILMGAMKKYFSYGVSCTCGIPRITLEGTKNDWEELLRRGDRLSEYGNECVLWHRMLMPILRRFVATFDDPRLEKEEIHQFWKNMVQYNRPSSGQPYITGWLTAFCVFNQDGKWKNYGAELPMMDGARYPQVDIQDIPPAYVSVDVTLNNNGDVYEAVIIAGLTTGHVSSSGDTRLSVSGNKDTVAPGVSWWLCNKVVKEPHWSI